MKTLSATTKQTALRELTVLPKLYFKNGILWQLHVSVSFIFTRLSGRVEARWCCRRGADVWLGSFGQGRTLLSKHEKHELHCCSSIDHRLFKRPPGNTIKSIIRCSTNPLEFIVISQTDLSIDQQLLGQWIHLCSKWGEAHQLIWLHRWMGLP